MANLETSLKEAMAIEGAIGIALVDYGSGMALGSLGDGGELDLNVAAAGNTDVVRAKMRAMELLNLHDNEIEDILVSLTSQYHLLRPLTMPNGRGLFLFLALNRTRSNLAMARHQLKRIELALEI
ncbi:hypothetical protein ACFVHB_37890 [Kitasatospora sp. NPDC127111]|uniref:hypothetical protein n=1 Tax=Kitasatospora sp. NPDC127111 TaxID=3345363 RepID=UPI00362BC948